MQQDILLQSDDLLHNVQMQEIFPDGKTFVDCVPKFPEDEIIVQYGRLKMNQALICRNLFSIITICRLRLT